MLKKTCPNCGKTWYSKSEFALLFCLDCETSMQHIPAQVIGNQKDVVECFWCGERMVKHKNGESVCPNCGWKDKEGKQ